MHEEHTCPRGGQLLSVARSALGLCGAVGMDGALFSYNHRLGDDKESESERR